MSDSTFSSLNSSTTIEISPQEKKEKLIREILNYAASGDLRPFIENILSTVKGSLELIKLFLDRGADIEIKDSLGITPLICAVQSGQLNAFYILLHRGAKIDVKDRNGCGIVH